MARVWNEELLRSLVARGRYYEANDDQKMYQYRKAAVKLEAIRKDIKLHGSTVVNKPNLGSESINQLCLSIIQGSEDVIPAWAAPYDPGASNDEIRELVRSFQSSNIDHFVEKTMQKRGGSYAILLAWREWKAKSPLADRHYMEEPDFKKYGPKWMDGRFMPEFHAGAFRTGWESRKTLQAHDFLLISKMGAGVKIRYTVTALGERCIDKIIQFFHNGVCPVGQANGDANNGVLGNQQGRRAANPNVSIDTTDKDLKILHDWVKEKVTSGDHSGSKDFKLSKAKRKKMHDYCDKLEMKYGISLRHDSDGSGRDRTLRIEIKSRNGNGAASSSTPVPKGGAGSSGSANVYGFQNFMNGADVMSDPLVPRSPTPRGKIGGSGTGHRLGGDAKRSRLVEEGARQVEKDTRMSPSFESLEDSDDELQRALAESMAFASAAASSTRKEPAEEIILDSDDCQSPDLGEDNDLDLKRAIEESLKSAARSSRSPQDNSPLTLRDRLKNRIDRSLLDGISGASSSLGKSAPTTTKRKLISLDSDEPPRKKPPINLDSDDSNMGVPDSILPAAQLVELIIDERERSSEAKPRELRKKIEDSVGFFSSRYVNGALSTSIETIPVSDFVFKSPDGILDVLVERKAIKDIVGRSTADDQTRQLERMNWLNGGGANILLIDGDPKHADQCRAFGGSGKDSSWSETVRYFRKEGEDLAVATAIRDWEQLLIYCSCLLTHGGVQVQFTGDQALEAILAGFAAACATPPADELTNVLFVDMKDFGEQSADARKKQKTENWNRSGKIKKTRAQKKELERPDGNGRIPWSFGGVLKRELGDCNLFLAFKATKSFWGRYEDGVKESHKTYSLNQPDGCITKFGRSSRDITKEGPKQSWYPTDGFSVDFKPKFVEIAALPQDLPFGDHFGSFQAFRAGECMASAQVNIFWLTGEEVFDLVSQQYSIKEYSSFSAAPIHDAVLKFIPSVLRRKPQDQPQRAHERCVVFLTNVQDGRKKYNQKAANGKNLPNDAKMDDCLAIFKAFLSLYKISCVHFDKFGPAFTSKMVRYITYELVKSVSEGELHFTTSGM